MQTATPEAKAWPKFRPALPEPSRAVKVASFKGDNWAVHVCRPVQGKRGWEHKQSSVSVVFNNNTTGWKHFTDRATKKRLGSVYFTPGSTLGEKIAAAVLSGTALCGQV
jgi:hypothetical protein